MDVRSRVRWKDRFAFFSAVTRFFTPHPDKPIFSLRMACWQILPPSLHLSVFTCSSTFASPSTSTLFLMAWPMIILTHTLSILFHIVSYFSDYISGADCWSPNANLIECQSRLQVMGRDMNGDIHSFLNEDSDWKQRRVPWLETARCHCTWRTRRLPLYVCIYSIPISLLSHLCTRLLIDHVMHVVTIMYTITYLSCCAYWDYPRRNPSEIAFSYLITILSCVLRVAPLDSEHL